MHCYYKKARQQKHEQIYPPPPPSSSSFKVPPMNTHLPVIVPASPLLELVFAIQSGNTALGLACNAMKRRRSR